MLAKKKENKRVQDKNKTSKEENCKYIYENQITMKQKAGIEVELTIY